MKWKEYYILGTIKGYRFQVINNWHEFKSEEWHLFSIFRSWRNTDYEFNFCLLGFKLRIFTTGELRFKRRQKQ